MAALLSCVGSNERQRYVVRGDSCALSTMHMSLAGDKPREVRLALCVQTEWPPQAYESILEMHALPNVETSGGLGRLRPVRDRSESL